MDKRLLLRVVTPEGEKLSVQADHVRLCSSLGSFGVLPGHAHMLAQIEPGEILYDDGSVRHSFATSGGVAEITGDSVTVLE